MPAGLPERRITMHVTIFDSTGMRVNEAGKGLGRVIVDGTGKVVPFWRGTRVAEDTRIPPNGDTTWDLTFSSPSGPGRVLVEITHVSVAPEVAAELGVTAERFELTSATVPFGAKEGAGHAGLPKIVRVEPPRAAMVQKKKGTR